MSAADHLNEFSFPKMQRRASRLRLDDPECSYGMCVQASSDFKRLHGGEQVVFWGPKNLSNAHEEWKSSADEDEQNVRYMGHTVNKVGNKIVDWTGSQFFGRGTPLPLVEDIDVYSQRFAKGPEKPTSEETYRHGGYSRARKHR